MECRYLPPVPTGIVRVTHPTLSFPIVPNGPAKITQVDMVLNQTPVAASYSETKKAVVYQPTQPLPPGEYHVQCRLAFDDASSFRQEWRFAVAADAVTDLPEPTVRQRALFDAVNALRRSLGQPPFALSKTLCAAAQAHARYARLNRSGDFHEEQLGRLGVTGVLPQDRTDAFGFVDPVREVGSTDTFSQGEGLVMKLFDAPYHRLPFLEPDACPLGTGSEGGLHDYLATVLEISRSETEATVVSPFPDQRRVPTTWVDNESPDPLRIHPPHSPLVGYVIVFAHFCPGAGRLTATDRITVTDMTLTAAGEEIQVFWNTPANDAQLTDSALLIPQQPLMPGTTYHVAVKAATEGGTDISREWDFTTAGAPPSVGRTSAGKTRAGVQVRAVGGALLVRFPQTVTRLQCYFNSSPVLRRSSPPVHADPQGGWLARYPVPPDVRTYRLLVTQGEMTEVVTGKVKR